jgi:transcriptional regulator with XRE-family HTH domain
MPPAPTLKHLCLSPEELRLSGLELFGDRKGWQSRLALYLGVDRSSVTRWLCGSVPVPLGASMLVRYYLKYGLPDTALEDPDQKSGEASSGSASFKA